MATLTLLGLQSTLSAQQKVQEPDLMAGIWEAADGIGGEVGIYLTLSTSVPGDAQTLVGVQQSLTSLDVGVYRRLDAEKSPASVNYFSTSAKGAATWDGKRLKVDWEKTQPRIHLDLVWSADSQSWRGHFAREGLYRETITFEHRALHRPSPLVGTWLDKRGLLNNCLHLVQRSDGQLMGWADDLHVPGRVRYARGIERPATMVEHYGEAAKVEMVGPNEIAVDLRANIPVCCSHSFLAKLSPDRNSLVGAWPAGPNQAPGSVRWMRVQGESCIAAKSRKDGLGE